MSEFAPAIAVADLPPGRAAEVVVTDRRSPSSTSTGRSTRSPAAARTAGGRSARASWTARG